MTINRARLQRHLRKTTVSVISLTIATLATGAGGSFAEDAIMTAAELRAIVTPLYKHRDELLARSQGLCRFHLVKEKPEAAALESVFEGFEAIGIERDSIGSLYGSATGEVAWKRKHDRIRYDYLPKRDFALRKVDPATPAMSVPYGFIRSEDKELSIYYDSANTTAYIHHPPTIAVNPDGLRRSFRIEPFYAMDKEPVPDLFENWEKMGLAPRVEIDEWAGALCEANPRNGRGDGGREAAS